MSRRLLKELLRDAWLKVLVLSLLGMGASACGVSLALASKKVIDIATGQGQGEILREGIILASIIVFQLALQIGITVLHVHTSASVKFNMQMRLFGRLLRKDKLSIDKFHSGELVHRLSGDTSIIAEGVADIVPAFLSVGTRIVLSFWAILRLEPVLAFICVAAGILMLVAADLYRRKTGALFRASRESEGKIRSLLQETVQNLSVIKAFSVYSIMKRQLKGLQKTSYDLTIRKNKISIWANVCFYTAVTIGYYVALAWGAWRISQGLMTFGTLTALLSLTGDITTPFRQLASLFPKYMSVCASAERLTELEELKEDGIELDKDVEINFDKVSSVKLTDISFTYGDDMVLKNTGCVIPIGKLTAIIGKSGVGKSTMLSLLTGVLKPNNGEIILETLDGDISLNGVKRDMFAYVPQDFLLLSGNVLENITLFDETPDRERVWEALKIAELDEEVKALPDGLETFLGEGGGRLSGGQRQRMAIARALYSDGKVLLLDEATSALSADAEKRIISNLREKGKTVILVTHRKTAVDLCDNLLSVEDGKILST